jgi:hypothetical protein
VFPARLLAQHYHDRWAAENTLDEWKTHLNGRKVPVRSKTPRLVIQESYGWVLAHWSVRCLMAQTAQQAQVSPLHLSFTGSVRVLRRALPTFQTAQSHERDLFSVGP